MAALPIDVVVKMKSFVDLGASKPVKALRLLLSFLVEVGLAYETVVEPEHVGIHPRNRGGIGVVAPDVIKLASDIATDGWSDSKVEAVCRELLPGISRTKRSTRRCLI